MRVLIVDDNAVNRRLPEIIMTQLGHQTQQADNGKTALEMLRSNPVDCVLLDISMPEMSGEEVCRAVRQDDALKHLYIIAYTAHAMSEERSAIMVHGFDDLLIKPVSKASMVSAMKVAEQAVKHRSTGA